MRAPAESAASFLPVSITLPHLQEAAATCMGCELYKRATRTVFGVGPPHATLMLIGEQPGDHEDRIGHPFVGPAGHILDKALEEAGIVRRDVYVTNAVKHFKWEPQGKRRKHKRPSRSEIIACRPWMKAELDAVRPRAVICLGATAAQAVFGKPVRINELRKQSWSTELANPVFVTVHPSAILRYPEAAQRDEEYHRFALDFRRIAKHLLDEIP